MDPDLRFTEDHLLRPVEHIARDLLGSCLVSTIDGHRVVGLVCETEAYGGPEDPASHAATRAGITARNRAMFGPPGHLYVYRSYGVHWCMNVVTGAAGQASAVLLRSAWPLEGLDVMASRRSGRRPVAVGPGRLTQALGVVGAHDGHPLGQAPIVLHPGWHVPRGRVCVTGRIGISTAADWPLRFYVDGMPGLRTSPSRSSEPGNE